MSLSVLTRTKPVATRTVVRTPDHRSHSIVMLAQDSALSGLEIPPDQISAAQPNYFDPLDTDCLTRLSSPPENAMNAVEPKVKHSTAAGCDNLGLSVQPQIFMRETDLAGG